MQINSSFKRIYCFEFLCSLTFCKKINTKDIISLHHVQKINNITRQKNGCFEARLRSVIDQNVEHWQMR